MVRQLISTTACVSHLDWQIENGVHGIAILGSTGSNGSFTEKEREELIKVGTKHINGRVPVMAGTGSLTTDEAVRMSRFAEDVGADAVIVVPITYWPLTENEVYEHYSSIAKAIKIPVVIYNNPGTTGVDIKPALLARLAEIDNIQGVKESSRRPVPHHPDPAPHQRQDDGVPRLGAGHAPGLLRRRRRLVPRPAEHPPARMRAAIRSLQKSGDLRGAQELFDRMYPICKLMGDTGYIRVVHSALQLMGRSVGEPRRPIRQLEADQKGATRHHPAKPGCPRWFGAATGCGIVDTPGIESQSAPGTCTMLKITKGR